MIKCSKWIKICMYTFCILKYVYDVVKKVHVRYLIS